MTSPVTGTPCISYTVKVQEYDSGGRNRSGKWRTIHTENRGGPFLLQDETGLVKVDPARAKMDQLNIMESTQGLFSDLGPGACNFIESRGIKDKGFFGLMKSKLKVKESVVPMNIHIYALGTAGIIVLEEELEKDPRVSVFTVRNEGKMILSYKSEKETSSHLKNFGFVLIILGGIFLLGGFSLMIILS